MVLIECPRCKGSGLRARSMLEAFTDGLEGQDSKCPLCGGTGYVDDGKYDITLQRK